MDEYAEVIVIADTAGLYELSDEAVAYLASAPGEFAEEMDLG